MKHYIQNITPDSFFTKEEKGVFLHIPHEVEKIHPKVEIIKFKTNNYFVNNINMVRVLEPLNRDELANTELRFQLLPSEYGFGKEETGLYIKSNSAHAIEKMIKELAKHDKMNAKEMLNNYLCYVPGCFDVMSMEEKFSRHTKQLKQYLFNEGLVVGQYDIDLSGYKGKDEDEQIKFVDSLYEKFGQDFPLPAYNDLDYKRFIHKEWVTCMFMTVLVQDYL